MYPAGFAGGLEEQSCRGKVSPGPSLPWSYRGRAPSPPRGRIERRALSPLHQTEHWAGNWAGSDGLQPFKIINKSFNVDITTVLPHHRSPRHAVGEAAKTESSSPYLYSSFPYSASLELQEKFWAWF